MRQMQILSPSEFKSRVDAVKSEYADDTLGKRYDRNRLLAELQPLAQSFQKLYKRIREAVIRGDCRSLGAIRNEIPTEELHVFSGMCLALTTKENRNLCSRLPDHDSIAEDAGFRRAFDGALTLLRGRPDTRRAKFRKLVPAEALADLAELSNSVATDEGVQAYKQRARASIAL